MSKRNTGNSRWISGRATLAIIGALFLSSAVLRFAAGPARAIANSITTQQEVSAQAPSPASDESVQKMLAAISERSRELDQREEKLAEMQKSVEMARAAIDMKLKELADAEARLSETIAQVQTASENDLAKLTSVYENMKPKQAASLFEQMAPEFAAGFLGRMRADAAAQIMASLSPENAYAISVVLAGRNANAPSE